MLRIIDRVDGNVIQKVTTPKNELVGYQVLKEGANDSSQVQRFPHLSAARKAAGETKQEVAHAD